MSGSRSTGGRKTSISRASCVHAAAWSASATFTASILGLKAGRVSGERFGYSQIVNPLYLIRKGTVPAAFALPLMGRNIAANLVRSMWPESYIDRRGRLRGNLIAIAHVLSGRIEPEYILKL